MTMNDSIVPDSFVLYWQTKNAVQKFLDSLLQKSGKLRGLIRELDDCYANSSVMQTQDSYHIACVIHIHIRAHVWPKGCLPRSLQIYSP